MGAAAWGQPGRILQGVARAQRGGGSAQPDNEMWPCKTLSDGLSDVPVLCSLICDN